MGNLLHWYKLEYYILYLNYAVSELSSFSRLGMFFEIDFELKSREFVSALQSKDFKDLTFYFK